MFLRFVVGADAESAWWLTGVITMAQALHDDGERADSRKGSRRDRPFLS